MRALRILLLVAVAVGPVLPASAAPPVPAAVTSFELRTPRGVQEVHLTALRESGGDVLLVQTQECDRRSCGQSVRGRVRLAPGALLLEQDRAELQVELAGRTVAASWAVAANSLTVGRGRVGFGGASEASSAEGFVGRTAAVAVLVDGTRCRTDGAVGSAFSERVGPAPAAQRVQLAAGTLRC